MIRFIAQPSGPVAVNELIPELVAVLVWADRWSRQQHVAVDVNAIDNGTHQPGSLHGASRAIDLDTFGDNRADLNRLYAYLRDVLPPGYDVVDEATHVHVEWDPHR